MVGPDLVRLCLVGAAVLHQRAIHDLDELVGAGGVTYADVNAADYCPTCGRPRELRKDTVESLGLKLCINRKMYWGDNHVYLTPHEASMMRILFEKNRRSLDYLTLLLSPESEQNIVRVYACRLRKKLNELTSGKIQLQTIRGYGYELMEAV